MPPLSVLAPEERLLVPSFSWLAPEGTGYRAKTRFARFFNLPELISLFKEAADVQTADMLNLPVPEAEYINEVLKPSEEQKEMVSGFAERAERVRGGLVEPTEDNMLKITNDGRKCALDQRLLNDMLPDDPDSKVNRCVENAFQVWEESTPKLGAGTNIQDRLIALHHLDCPWKPADLEQQEGRILRQGNRNKKVKIFRYVTENTFDSYMWQILENKQKFISQVLNVYALSH